MPKAKAQTPATQHAPAPAQAPAPVVQAAVASKQEMTLSKLKEAWTARGVLLERMEVKPDGKFLFVTVGPTWPVIRIGATGGIELPQLRSYPKAFDAAVLGDKLFAKQNGAIRRKRRLPYRQRRRWMLRKRRRKLSRR